MHLIKNSLQNLIRHRKPLLVFEILWKLITGLVFAPACGGCIQLTIKAAGLQYLTNANLLQFLRSPWTILLLLLLLLFVALYTLFEIAAVCCCFSEPPKQKLRLTLRSMVRCGIHSLGAFFRGGSPLLVLHLLVMIPLMQFSATSGVFTAIGIPDFMAYYMTKKEFLMPIYVGAIILCALFCVRWIFSTVLFTQHNCKFRSARKCSAALVKGAFWKTFFSVLLWNLCYLAILMLFLCIITLVVLLLIKGTSSGTLILSQATNLLKLLMQIVLWGFSFFSTPICIAHIVALLERRHAQRTDVALPTESASPLRNAKPFHRAVAILTTVSLSLAALTLNFSYLYSLSTGNSTLLLTFYQDPTIMAHRGLSADAPENTLYAFSDAIEANADYIELDVQQTKDGVLVVLHDTNLSRTTGLEQNIWDVTYDEIKDLDAGSWFDPMYANARIPTLEETLQFVDHRVQLNIEIKPTAYTSDTLEQDVVDLITAYGYENDCIVTSFSYSALKAIKTYNSAIRTGYIMSVAYGQFYNLQYTDAFSLNKVFVTSQAVNYAHQYGKEVYAWTVNSVSEVRSLYNLHVDGIITDDPLMAQDVIAHDSTGETLQTVLDYLIN